MGGEEIRTSNVQRPMLNDDCGEVCDLQLLILLLIVILFFRSRVGFAALLDCRAAKPTRLLEDYD